MNQISETFVTLSQDSYWRMYLPSYVLTRLRDVFLIPQALFPWELLFAFCKRHKSFIRKANTVIFQENRNPHKWLSLHRPHDRGYTWHSHKLFYYCVFAGAIWYIASVETQGPQLITQRWRSRSRRFAFSCIIWDNSMLLPPREISPLEAPEWVGRSFRKPKHSLWQERLPIAKENPTGNSI